MPTWAPWSLITELNPAIRCTKLSRYSCRMAGPGHVGAAALLAHQVPVGDQAVDRAAQRDAADAVLRAEHGLRRAAASARAAR